MVIAVVFEGKIIKVNFDIPFTCKKCIRNGNSGFLWNVEEKLVLHHFVARIGQ